eukprot:GILJ01012172.1.p1 GENE.GILJ01012172.1~~GILJ01012172.1.p1  ORF type:complete len:293 (-),score=20.79 GILJ01012172.1:275-1153(-)
MEPRVVHGDFETYAYYADLLKKSKKMSQNKSNELSASMTSADESHLVDESENQQSVTVPLSYPSALLPTFLPKAQTFGGAGNVNTSSPTDRIEKKITAKLKHLKHLEVAKLHNEELTNKENNAPVSTHRSLGPPRRIATPLKDEVDTDEDNSGLSSPRTPLHPADRRVHHTTRRPSTARSSVTSIQRPATACVTTFRKTDPVARYQQLSHVWAGDSFLKNSVGNARKHNVIKPSDVHPTPRRIDSTPSTTAFVAPTAKRRDDVRWHMRMQMRAWKAGAPVLPAKTGSAGQWI